MAASVFKAGNRALITGGASGIGLALAKKCHQHGMKVGIVDINQSNLDAAKKSIGDNVTTYVTDVGKMEQWADLKKMVEADLGRIDLLALNAGMGLKGSWEDASYFHTLLNTNLFGVIHGISTFLPVLQQGASKDHPAAIVITGSKQGITNPPSNPAYNASKAAVKTLAEHLSFDLRNDADRLSVHLLVPGWTYTGLTGATPDRSQPEGAWTPEQVVEYLEKKMAAGQFYVICPDNDVTEDLDRRRILWSAGDIVEGRPPLNRWREDWKDKAAKGISEMKI